MKKMYFVAVYAFGDSIKTISTSLDSCFFDDNMEQARSLERDGYILCAYITTTERETYLRARLKASLLELRATTIGYEKFNASFENGRVSLMTARLQAEYLDTLMDKVALCCSRLLREGIEVTDELAIECHKRRQAKLRENAI